MKKYKVRPAEHFELEFSDGKIIEMCFNTRAIAILGERINEGKIKLTGPDFFSAILYCGAKSVNPEFTIEEANALYVTLEESNSEALTGIIEEYCDAAGIDKNAITKNLMSLLQ